MNQETKQNNKNTSPSDASDNDTNMSNKNNSINMDQLKNYLNDFALKASKSKNLKLKKDIKFEYKVDIKNKSIPIKTIIHSIPKLFSQTYKIYINKNSGIISIRTNNNELINHLLSVLEWKAIVTHATKLTIFPTFAWHYFEWTPILVHDLLDQLEQKFKYKIIGNQIAGNYFNIYLKNDISTETLEPLTVMDLFKFTITSYGKKDLKNREDRIREKIIRDESIKNTNHQKKKKNQTKSSQKDNNDNEHQQRNEEDLTQKNNERKVTEKNKTQENNKKREEDKKRKEKMENQLIEEAIAETNKLFSEEKVESNQTQSTKANNATHPTTKPIPSQPPKSTNTIHQFIQPISTPKSKDQKLKDRSPEDEMENKKLKDNNGTPIQNPRRLASTKHFRSKSASYDYDKDWFSTNQDQINERKEQKQFEKYLAEEHQKFINNIPSPNEGSSSQ